MFNVDAIPNNTSLQNLPTDKEDIERALRLDAERYITQWADQYTAYWKRNGVEVSMLNPHRDDRKLGSFMINTETFKWRDFATGDGGNDLIGFYGFLTAQSFSAVCEQLATYLGLSTQTAWRAQRSGHPATSASTAYQVPQAARPYEPRAEQVGNNNCPHSASSETANGPVIPVPSDLEDEALASWKGPAPSGVWHYRDAKGRLVQVVARRDHKDGRKSVYVYTLWNGAIDGAGNRVEAMTWRAQPLPGPKPLFNRDKLAERPKASVLLVEGEKVVSAVENALRGVMDDMVITTWTGGTNCAGNVDLTPLHGRHVILSADNDTPGQTAMRRIAEALSADVGSIRELMAPRKAPKGWDLADEAPETIISYIASARVGQPLVQNIDLPFSEYSTRGMSARPAAQEWVIEDLIPKGKVTLVVADGAVGKSMLMLNLGYEMATWDGDPETSPKLLGRKVCCNEPMLFLSGEDDHQSIHTRLAEMNYKGADLDALNLIVKPYPDAGLAQLVVKNGNGEVKTTREYDRVQRAALEMQAGAIVADTLTTLTAVTLNDATEAQNAMNCYNQLARRTGAAVVLLYHINKPNLAQMDGKGRLRSMTPEMMRPMVKGSTQVVNAVRNVLGLWTLNREDLGSLWGKTHSNTLPVDVSAVSVIRGGLLKANHIKPGEASRGFEAVIADSRLHDAADWFTAQLPDDVSLETQEERQLRLMAESIARITADGTQITKTGANGVQKQKALLDVELQGLGRDRLERLVGQLLSAGRLEFVIQAGHKTSYLRAKEQIADAAQGSQPSQPLFSV